MNQVELEDFYNLVQEGRMLPLNMPEIDEIIELEQKIQVSIVIVSIIFTYSIEFHAEN